jgi:hypothetical protein
LADFPVLKVLGCPAESLKSRWELFGEMWVEDLWHGEGLHKILPASLERLKLYVYDDWSINGWTPDLVSIFEQKAAEFPELREIWVDY